MIENLDKIQEVLAAVSIETKQITALKEVWISSCFDLRGSAISMQVTIQNFGQMVRKIKNPIFIKLPVIKNMGVIQEFKKLPFPFRATVQRTETGLILMTLDTIVRSQV